MTNTVHEQLSKAEKRNNIYRKIEIDNNIIQSYPDDGIDIDVVVKGLVENSVVFEVIQNENIVLCFHKKKEEFFVIFHGTPTAIMFNIDEFERIFLKQELSYQRTSEIIENNHYLSKMLKIHYENLAIIRNHLKLDRLDLSESANIGDEEQRLKDKYKEVINSIRGKRIIVTEEEVEKAKENIAKKKQQLEEILKNREQYNDWNN